MSPATTPTDYIVQFPDFATAKASYEYITQTVAEDEQLEQPCWVYGIATFMPVKVVTQEAVYGEADEMGNSTLVTPEVYATGYWVAVRFMAHDTPTSDELTAKALVQNHPMRIDWDDVPGRLNMFFAGSVQPTD